MLMVMDWAGEAQELAGDEQEVLDTRYSHNNQQLLTMEAYYVRKIEPKFDAVPWQLGQEETFRPGQAHCFRMPSQTRCVIVSGDLSLSLVRSPWWDDAPVRLMRQLSITSDQGQTHEKTRKREQTIKNCKCSNMSLLRSLAVPRRQSPLLPRQNDDDQR